jgi:predicted nucleic acid-binding protein
VKAIDTNLLIYASLANHPACIACEQFIATEPTWVTNIVNLVELLRVLVGVYGVSEGDVGAKFEDFRQVLVVAELSSALAAASLPLRQTYGIDFNDAILLQTCRERGVTTLATDDNRLANACAAVQIAVENPVDAALRTQMAQWENANLPAKGLPRVLLRVHRWLEQRDPAVATEFHSATQALSRLV